MTKAYLKCVRVGGDDWQSSKDGCGVVVSLDGGNLVEVRVGDVVVVENPELTSLFSTMPPDKQQVVLDCDGPEDHGDPEWQNPTTRLLQHWIDEDGDTLSPTLEQDKADLNAVRLKLGER